MSNRSAVRGTAAASSIRLTLRTSNAVATSNASPSRCFLFCEGSRAARSARTAAATVSTPPIPKAPSNQRRSPPTTSSFQGARILMGGEALTLWAAARERAVDELASKAARLSGEGQKGEAAGIRAAARLLRVQALRERAQAAAVRGQ